MAIILQMKSITKEYKGVPVLKNVDFDLEEKEIHALVGENGAGKSTLTKILAGAVTTTRGEIILDGKPIKIDHPTDGVAHGIAMVFQETSLVPSLTVAQNLFLGKEKFYNRLRTIYIAAQQFLQSLNFSVNPSVTVARLGAAQKQMVEIARAVYYKARIIIFDEPTAPLTPEEKHHFFALLNRLQKAGVTIIFITHVLEEALQSADRITVLRDGEIVVTDNASNFTRDRIVQAMVGRQLSGGLYDVSAKGKERRKAGRRVLSVQNLSMQNIVRNNSFSVFAGQVTGIFGLVGSGRTETAKIIAGVVKRDLVHGGEVKFEGRSVRYKVPKPAVKDGIIYVTEDRKIEGFFETMSIARNIYIGVITAGLTKSFVVNRNEMHKLAEHWTKALNIKATDSNARVIELSGGNQQKVVIAKALAQRPKLIIFDEPTRGVDVGAIAEIHQIINKLADDGLPVVVISSYLPEILYLSDRILVSRQGRIVEEFNAADATEDMIMYAAVH
ncbi:MAG: sugar ABC transporter ATP-binding protein [Syntrophobacteraceae bacterium]